MRYLLISCLFIVSCKSITTINGLEKEEVSKAIKNPYFSNIETDYVYKAKIASGKNNFGGLLIIKKIKEAHHRIVFTTEFGNKIFDFEFISDTFKVNYVLEKLNRKIILNALKKDYELLIKENYVAEHKFKSSNEIIYRVDMNKKDNYFIFDNKKALTKIVMSSKRKEKMSISFSNFEKNLVKYIKMEHYNFNMLTELKYINN